MEGMRLLHTLRLTNFLSYGPEGTEIELQPLNVLIGPNGSGKSNFIEAIGLLKAAPADISAPIRAGGGMPEWVWKGEEEEEESSTSGGSVSPIDLTVQTTVSYPDSPTPLLYRFELESVGQHLRIVDEVIEKEDSATGDFFYSYEQGEPVLNTREYVSDGDIDGFTRSYQCVDPDGIDTRKSILSQRRDPDHYPELTYLGATLSEIQLFRSVNVGHKSPLRGLQRADEPASFLLEDGRNLGMVLNDLLNRPPTKRLLLEKLNHFYEYVEDVTTKIYAGTVETSFHERGFAEATPANRLSDGTLLYLRLLTILCHPSPPPLVCIEEPETGLHPSALSMVAELLIEASQRTQLIVTTHSDTLVSEFSSMPEAVVVCERDDWGSHLRRLDADQLKEFLEKYPLGELWRMGETGGNPW